MSDQSQHNQSSIKKILQACEKFKNKEISVIELQGAIEDYGPLLEGVDREVFEVLYDFTGDLELIQHASPKEEHYDRTSKVIEEVYSFVQQTFGDIE